MVHDPRWHGRCEWVIVMTLVYVLMSVLIVLYAVTIGLQIRAARRAAPSPTLEDIAAVSERVTALETQTAELTLSPWRQEWNRNHQNTVKATQ